MEARLKTEQRDEAYRIYITDALKAISGSTSKFAGGNYISERYYDLINPKPKDTRTAEDIINSIKKGLGG